MTITKGFRAQLKIVRMFFCALPMIFGLAATPLSAAASKAAETPAGSVLVAVATVHVAKKPGGKIAPAAISGDAAKCESPKQRNEATAASVDKGSADSDISTAENNSSEEAETPANGSRQDLVRDRLQLSLETRSAEIDSPQSCKPN